MAGAMDPNERHRTPFRWSVLIPASIIQEMLVTDKLDDVDGMIDVTVRSGFAHLIPILHPFRGHPAPLSVILDHFRSRIALDAYIAWRGVQADLSGTRLGIVPPLPPHVVRLLAPYATDLLVPDPDAPYAHEPVQLGCARHEGARACRRAAAGVRALAFEICTQFDGWFVQPEVLDVIEDAGAPGRVLLLGYARMRRLPGDLLLERSYPVQLL